MHRGQPRPSSSRRPLITAITTSSFPARPAQRRRRPGPGDRDSRPQPPIGGARGARPPGQALRPGRAAGRRPAKPARRPAGHLRKSGHVQFVVLFKHDRTPSGAGCRVEHAGRGPLVGPVTCGARWRPRRRRPRRRRRPGRLAPARARPATRCCRPIGPIRLTATSGAGAALGRRLPGVVAPVFGAPCRGFAGRARSHRARAAASPFAAGEAAPTGTAWRSPAPGGPGPAPLAGRAASRSRRTLPR